ncbi:hypothetical protein CY34DRAFT_804715 [Suillus luteus UH-Slu-Lm8-n1]|uniref:Uncharacterized protein n=1 Tax=Suillus luteus UH-Slu-Lm8-n1 TaxID=930992 RepID=A0A0D0BHI9_9AGAM|nr:hypothetical protein CY34DRAFT_804715 [Suillus luteus UH-Slu-Lm8-n1]
MHLWAILGAADYPDLVNLLGAYSTCMCFPSMPLQAKHKTPFRSPLGVNSGF